MSAPKFKKYDRVLWEGFDSSGGVYVYAGVVVDAQVGKTTGEVYYACYFPELKPSPQLILTEGELMPLKKRND